MKNPDIISIVMTLKTGRLDIRPPAVLVKKAGEVEKGQAVDEWRATGRLKLQPGFPLPIPVNLPAEAIIEGEVNLADIIIRNNPDISNLKRVVLEGITVEGYRECNYIQGFAPPNLMNIISIDSDAGGWSANVHMKDKAWKPNNYQLNLEFPNPLRSRVKIRRHLKVDMWGTLGGYCTIASRNVVLHVMYQYEGLPPPPGELYIHVVDAVGFRPIRGAMVRISYSDGTPVAAVETDSSGTARFVLPKGDYVAVVDLTGYEVAKKAVHCPGEYTLTLVKKKPPSGPIIPLPQVPPQVQPLVNTILWVGGLGLALYAGYKLVQAGVVETAVEKVSGLVEKVRGAR